MYSLDSIKGEDNHESLSTMNDLSNKTVSDTLARLLENEDRYAHRVAQADVLKSELNQLQTEGSALIQTLNELWVQRKVNPSDKRQHTTVMKVRDRLQSLCTKARTTCETAQLEPSARRILDSIIQQLLDIQRATLPTSTDLPSHNAVMNPTDLSTFSPSSCQSTTIFNSAGSGLSHQQLQVVKPMHQQRVSQVLTCSDSGKAVDLAQNVWKEGCSKPSTTIERTRPSITCSPSRQIGVKVEAPETECRAPTLLEARMIKRRSRDDELLRT